jgi:hypothetical protein
VPDAPSRADARAGESAYAALGLRFTVSADEAEIDRAVDVFVGSAVDGGGADYRVSRRAPGYVLTRDGDLVACTKSWEHAVGALLVDLNARAINAFGGFAVHAGAVAIGDDVIVFPAPSGAGKSTMTAAALRAGCAYVSDEALCLAPASGSVVPYPKPIALSAPGWAMSGWRDRVGDGLDDGEKVVLTPAQLGVRIASGRARCAHIVLLERGAAPLRLTPVSRAEGLRTMLRMSFNHYKAPETAFRLASEVATRAQVWQLEYSDPRAAADHLATQLAR